MAEEKDGPCGSQLFTLKPGSDPNASVKQLMNIGDNYASTNDGPLYQNSGGQRLYINFADFLNDAPEVAPE